MLLNRSVTALTLFLKPIAAASLRPLFPPVLLLLDTPTMAEAEADVDIGVGLSLLNDSGWGGGASEGAASGTSIT